jgi:hypothetical protein
LVLAPAIDLGVVGSLVPAVLLGMFWSLLSVPCLSAQINFSL